ncbi:hypothetical protein [Vibrio harveyi]|uniref:hypothetical protein n=1 Tax=Vibrio harveyi TaxID=669 RepID=UPI00390AAF18
MNKLITLLALTLLSTVATASNIYDTNHAMDHWVLANNNISYVAHSDGYAVMYYQDNERYWSYLMDSQSTCTTDDYPTFEGHISINGVTQDALILCKNERKAKLFMIPVKTFIKAKTVTIDGYTFSAMQFTKVVREMFKRDGYK